MAPIVPISKATPTITTGTMIYASATPELFSATTSANVHIRTSLLDIWNSSAFYRHTRSMYHCALSVRLSHVDIIIIIHHHYLPLHQALPLLTALVTSSLTIISKLHISLTSNTSTSSPHSPSPPNEPSIFSSFTPARKSEISNILFNWTVLTNSLTLIRSLPGFCSYVLPSILLLSQTSSNCLFLTSGQFTSILLSMNVSSTVWVQKIPLRFSDIFQKRLGVFNLCFTLLLCVYIYARLQIFIQLSPILTKLCHTKRDHPSNFWHFTRT